MRVISLVQLAQIVAGTERFASTRQDYDAGLRIICKGIKSCLQSLQHLI
jgi:hypothetical protein